MQSRVSRISSIGTLARYTLALYIGATLALVLPFTSPFWEPLASGARLLAELIR